MDDHANRAPSRAMDGHDDHRVGAGRRAGPRRTAPQCVASHRTTSRIIAAIVAARCGQPRGDCPYAMRFIANRCGQSLFHVAGNHGGLPLHNADRCAAAARPRSWLLRVRIRTDALWATMIPCAVLFCTCAVSCWACEVSLCHRRVLCRHDRVFDSPMCGVLLRLCGVFLPQKSVVPARSGVRFTHV